MSKVWPPLRLSDVAAISYGHTASASVERVGPKFLRITDIQNGGVDWNSVPYARIDESEIDRYRLREGDIVFARTGATTGKSFLIDSPPEAVFASYLIRLRLSDDAHLIPEFVSLFFQTETYWSAVKEGSSGSAQGGFNASKLGALSIPRPPVSEQRRIVAILGKTFESIAIARTNAEKNLQSARELFESQRDEVFASGGSGYGQFSLGEVCAITSQLVDPRKKEFARLLHVGAGNMQSETGVLADLQTAQDEKLISAKFMFGKSAVLYSKIRPYLKKAARADFAGLCSADVYPLEPIEGRMVRDYLYHLLLSNPFTKYAIEGSARAGMPKVNRDHLFAFRCWLPGIGEQTQLATKLDRLEEETRRLESIYRRKLATLDELKQSLLHQAFSVAP